MSSFQDITIYTMDKLYLFFEAASECGEKWIFRGQKDSRWKLRSSLERQMLKYGIITENTELYLTQQKQFKKAEEDILEMAKRTMLAYPLFQQFADNELDLLAYIQHYGGVTRLLDFTDSFAVALFFAVEDPISNGKASVWCISRDAINQQMGNRNERREKASKFLEEDEEVVLSFAPGIINERMNAQQGLFIAPGTFRKSLHQLICDKFGFFMDEKGNIIDKNNSQEDIADFKKMFKSKALLKVNVDSILMNRILEFLRKINVSANTLFPGVDGLGRSIQFLASGYRHHSFFNREA